MMFCPKCGAIMSFKQGVWKCNRCGYEMHANNSGRRVTLSRVIKHSEKEKTIVIEDRKIAVPPTAVLVKDQVRCPKCEHNEVYAWQIQTRAADEPSTTFYRCTKCGYTWREY